MNKTIIQILEELAPTIEEGYLSDVLSNYCVAIRNKLNKSGYTFSVSSDVKDHTIKICWSCPNSKHKHNFNNYIYSDNIFIMFVKVRLKKASNVYHWGYGNCQKYTIKSIEGYFSGFDKYAYMTPREAVDAVRAERYEMRKKEEAKKETEKEKTLSIIREKGFENIEDLKQKTLESIEFLMTLDLDTKKAINAYINDKYYRTINL